MVITDGNDSRSVSIHLPQQDTSSTAQSCDPELRRMLCHLKRTPPGLVSWDNDRNSDPRTKPNSQQILSETDFVKYNFPKTLPQANPHVPAKSQNLPLTVDRVTEIRCPAFRPRPLQPTAWVDHC
ncbi:hypothetical protein RvY_12730 [Ramazzottius varieornatus]|uniref:Uncharacterized protein n=1 Tax=Ramazzottius varieornatus TaxID=947166 RepID=A0A1D1VQX8_RAMVA|nr:hypothetical protein RvY_12730 [Ramazzottius varieornatus]